MSRGSKKLDTGSRVAVVGGGPAGSFFALYLLHYAQQRGICPDVTIYQEKDFGALGPRGCKGGAGVLSISLTRNLRDLGLTVPQEIIQSKIERYAVHSPYTSISISNPEAGTEIVSIYRGGGPSKSEYRQPISFDGWLLAEAQKRGARVENQKVTRVHLDHGAAVEAAGGTIEYDLVVLATGANSRQISIVGLDYAPPPTRNMALAELYLGNDQVKARLGDVAHVLLIPHSGLIFGTLVPKGPFINICLLSAGEFQLPMKEFLNHDLARRFLPEDYHPVCTCQPRTLVGAARNYYGNGFVAVGDAAVSKLYKDGIGSALQTSREAARTAVCHGLSGQHFKRYYEPFCRGMEQYNRWGRLLFFINNKAKDSRNFLLTQHQLIGDEQNNVKGPQPFTKAAWGMFTGSYRYRDIARMAFGLRALMKLDGALIRNVMRTLSGRGGTYPKRLHVGRQNVLILGSGFAGTGTLRHLVRSLNRNENVETTMVSEENFFLFSPLLHEVALGGIEARHIAFPIRKLHWRDRFNFLQARVERIDISRRRVITTEGTLDFDYLVLALGSVTNTLGLDVSGEGNIFTLKTLQDSLMLRNHVIELFERASLETDAKRQKQMLTFVVSGAGYTGVQVVTELRDFVFRTLTRFYKNVDPGNVGIILVEVEPKIVASLHTRLGAYVMNHLRRTGIEVRLKSQVTRARDGAVEINGREVIPTNTLIWVAGISASPRVAELEGVAKDAIGRILVNEYLEVPGFSGVYALGDCAHFKDSRSGQPLPPRAHTAVRQAKIVAKNILAQLRGADKRTYRYSDFGEIVSLGSAKAVFRFRGLRLYGFPARLVWLAAYAWLVSGTYNRIRTVTDWLLSLVFGRDITYVRMKQ